MTSKTLRHDLHRNLADRLNRLLQDTCDLYELAGLAPGDATVDIFGLLINTLAYASVKMDLSDTELLAAIARRLQAMRREEEKGPLRGAR